MRAHLATLGISDEQQQAAGLLVRRNDDEEPRPRFRQRIMFPIHDLSARCIGFGGRVLGDGQPKYLNSPETPAFAKGQTLYNLHQAKLAMRKDDRAFIVEGYFDVIRLALAGVECAVAPLGTALTDEQAKLVTRYTRNIILLYDSDRAGLKATFRAGDALLRNGASVRVVSLPPGDDPDTFVCTHGSTGLEAEVQKSIDVFERKIQILERGGWFGDLQRRRKAIDHLLPTIRATADQVMREIYIARASEVSGVDRTVLVDEAANEPTRRRTVGSDDSRGGARAVVPPPPQEGPAARRGARPQRRPAGGSAWAEEALVRTMLVSRGKVERVAEHVGPDSFHEPRYREIFSILLEVGPEGSVEDMVARLSPASVEMLQALLAEPDAIQNIDQTLEDSLRKLERIRLETRNRQVEQLIRVASETEKNQLLSEMQSNRREIARLSDAREGGGS